MKKLLSIILIIVMCISISSCTFNTSLIINADGKVETIQKISLSKTEAETIKETAKSKIGQKVDLGDGEEIFDAQMYGMVVGYVETFIQQAKTEEINGETYYYTLEKETSTVKKINSDDKYDSSKAVITTTDFWIYDKNERIQKDLSMDNFYDSDEIDYISTFGGTFVVEIWLKMPYKITKTNFEKVDDYTVDMSKPGDPKFAYVITEKSTADWTKSENIFEEVLNQYENNKIYKIVVDSLKDFIESKIDLEAIDYISGGERRDWYFSLIMAYLLGKPHITIYKDLSAVVSTCDFEEATPVEKLEGKRILHIADLLNTASSYVRSWVPAIKALGSNIVSSVVVVDRMQGGGEILSDLGVRSLSLLQINETLFEKAKDLGIINDAQLEMLNKFTEEPDKCMRDFLIAHPEFLEHSINSSDAKTAKRAKSCKEQNLYNI